MTREDRTAKAREKAAKAETKAARERRRMARSATTRSENAVPDDDQRIDDDGRRVHRPTKSYRLTFALPDGTYIAQLVEASAVLREHEVVVFRDSAGMVVGVGAERVILIERLDDEPPESVPASD